MLTFRAEEEALALANGVDYGLTASVWTDDLRRAHRFAAAFEAGLRRHARAVKDASL